MANGGAISLLQSTMSPGLPYMKAHFQPVILSWAKRSQFLRKGIERLSSWPAGKPTSSLAQRQSIAILWSWGPIPFTRTTNPSRRGGPRLNGSGKRRDHKWHDWRTIMAKISVLVTGSTGKQGGHVARHLLK